MMQFASVFLFAATAAAACNGYDALCSLKYSELHQVGSHDSAFVGILPTENQYTSVATQLSSGVRFLQGQTHNKDGTIEMCHTYCIEEDAGSLAEYLEPIADFLDSNANEVVTLLLTNGDGISVSDYGTVFESAGLSQYAFSPDGILSQDDWPTLQELIDDSTRLIVFMDYYADTSEVSYINDEFSYFWETTYDVTDSSFPSCSVDRPSGGNPDTLMGIMNHFLDDDVLGIDIPDAIAAGTTNGNASIMAEYEECVSLNGVGPKVILLDYISIGDAISVQNQLNGVA